MQNPARRFAFAMLLTMVACSARAPAGRTDLAVLREATQSFHSLDAAVAAGYKREVKDCLVHEHHGAMGYHHVNQSLMDSVADVAHPEILLYERTDGGEYRLNGVEYIVPYRAWPRENAPPVIMGQRMMREDNLKFWYLHVWAWKENPEGLYANFHPNVQCAVETRKIFRPSE